ncbi:MAG: putative selenate reductase subunit YgfK [Fretibacterium sp.]|nr:putative selenate reductase subunit YgfK [Fretibacterium sp.]
MSDIMTPIPFPKLMERILDEHEKGSCDRQEALVPAAAQGCARLPTAFGVRKCYKANPNRYFTLFGRKLETQIGPAAGPNTQLAQNIVASYYGGARFFELKTVQKIDGRELAAAVHKPCIWAEDECYNCEWSTELTVQQAYEEYVKAWFALRVIAKEWGLGSPDGFQFNISVGYDLEGIRGPKINTFIDNIMNAGDTPVWKECKAWLKAHLNRFSHITEEDVEAINPDIVNSATVSTLHGCPPQEIEAIASYLLTEKGLHTFIKCNPTLLGYEEARRTLDDMGYGYIQFTDVHFKGDLQYADAIPMLTRLKKLAAGRGLEFGVKITNTFPVDVTRNELPSAEMYMSGKSLYPLSLRVARNLSRDFKGELRISFSGGCDFFNIARVISTGIWPVTMATTLLKPGGYERLVQIAERLDKEGVTAWQGVDVPALEALSDAARTDPHHVKPVKPLPKRKSEAKVPLVDCFTAPCSDRCPIHQDITAYGQLVGEGKFAEALRVILAKNPLPFITGNLCTHTCQTACTRNHYETPVQIRSNKLIAARKGYDTVIRELKPGASNGKKIIIIGAGPAGIAAAFFLARAGADVTVYDENERAGGVIRNVIPSFRIPQDEIQKDVALAEAAGAKFVLNHRVESIKDLKADAVLLAIGAHQDTPLTLKQGKAINALDFLKDFKKHDGHLRPGENIAVVGGGNTAMDTARAAKRTDGVKNVCIVYRRTRRYMPADEEELNDALADGVEFKELLAPVSLENGRLICHKMELGEADASGRRGVRETDEVVEIACDTVIASIGEKIGADFYRANGIEVDAKGQPVLNPDTCETSLKGVYAIGDGAFGASVVVRAIADAQKACSALLGRDIATGRKPELTDLAVYARRGILEEAPQSGTADTRCLTCDLICENCVEVCPNRANVSIRVPGHKNQIIHVDSMCNECGNCTVFCPYDSSPYRDKFTLFADEADMKESENDGFAFKGTDKAVVRVAGEKFDYQIGQKDTAFDARLAGVIDAVFRDYPYLRS